MKILALACAAFLAACSPSQAPSDAGIAPAFTADELAAPPRENWITNGGSLFNQRYSPLTEINRDTVGGLKAVRRFSLEGSGLGPRNSGQGQPLVYDGVIYQVTGDDDVFAFDIDSGETLWRYHANLDPDAVQACCGWVSRGLGLGEGKVFLGRLDAHLVALDQKTGEVVWDIVAEDSGAGYSITSAPLYFDGMVITGFAGGEYEIRGRVKAYDAYTGDLVWTFHTVPGPGEPGHDSWPADNDSWERGGAPVWQTPAVDPELGMIYFSTGNPGPDDWDGSDRAGDNLFSVSIVALDVHTGEYRWHYQQVHHDIWDYDASQPVVLFDVLIPGEDGDRLRKGISEINKAGYLFILDRTNGEPLTPIVETPVPQEPAQATAPTQPIPQGDHVIPHEIDIAPEGYALVNQGRTYTPSPPGEERALYTPLAGANWPPPSYDPATHTLYLCASNSVGGGRGGLGGPTGAVSRGIYAAVDVTSHRLVWRQAWAERCYSGSTATAGGLLFVGRNDGRLTALDSADGMMLWEFQTDAGVHAPVTVFEHDGVEYVLAYAGGTLFARDKRGDGLWLFSLNGTMDPLPPGAADPAAAAQPVLAAVAPPPGHVADLDHGEAIYRQACLPCHGAEGQGGGDGGAPAYPDALVMETILTTATNGRNAMPAFGPVLSPEDLHDVASYILEELKPE